MKQKTFYVYLHRKKSDNSIFYVGKGSAKRAKRTQGRSQYWQRIVDKHGFYVEIVAGFTEETLAFELESFLISEIGRDNLCNLTDGGEGCSGRVMSDAQRQKASRMLKGKAPLEAVEASKFYNSKPIGTVCGLRFGSFVEAVQWLRDNGHATACTPGISSCTRGISSSAYGYEWRYLSISGHLEGSLYIDRTSKSKKPVGTSCGLRFDSAHDASRWLRSVGYEKSLPSDIGRNCNGHTNMCHGYRFGFIVDGKYSPAKLKVNKKRIWVVNSMGLVFQSIRSAHLIMLERYSLKVSQQKISESIKKLTPDRNGVHWRLFSE